MKIVIFLLIVMVVLSRQKVFAQVDSLPRFNGRELIAPVALIGAGVLGITIPAVRKGNIKLRDYIQSFDPPRIGIDDYIQYAPTVGVYALNLFGVKGEHNYVDCTIILATAYLTMGLIVNSVKYTTRVERPNGSSAHNSFPSGHTATAFMGAEFLRMEYRDQSPWIGITGYGVATLTGCLRVYNNKHWLTDVAVGAGVGILSTKVAYWLFPTVRSIFPPSKGPHAKPKETMMLAPFYNGGQVGASFCASF